MIVQSLTYTEYTLKAWKTLYVFVLLIAGYRKAASWQLLPASGKTYLPCQVALCQNTLDKVLMTYGGKNMLGKRLNCHSVHVMVDDYYTRHVNIDQPNPRNGISGPRNHLHGLCFRLFIRALVPDMFLSVSLTTFLFHNTSSIELTSHTLHISLRHQIVLP